MTGASSTTSKASTAKTKPFVLSSRAAFNEESIFAGREKPTTPISKMAVNCVQSNGDCEENNGNNDASQMVPNTPPHIHKMKITPPTKKAKYILKRCFEATFNPSAVDGADLILAPDSDDERS